MAEWIEPRDYSHGELVTHLDMEALIRNNLTYLYEALQPVPLVKIPNPSGGYDDRHTAGRHLMQTIPLASNGGDLIINVSGNNMGGSARILTTVTETHTIDSTGYVTKTVEGKSVRRRTGTTLSPRGATLQKTIAEANIKIRNIRASDIPNKDAAINTLERQKTAIQGQLNREYRAVYQDVREPSKEVRVSVPTSRVVTNQYRKDETLTWSDLHLYYQIGDGALEEISYVRGIGEYDRTVFVTGVPAGSLSLKIYWTNDKGDVSFEGTVVNFNTSYKISADITVKQLSGFAV